MTPTYIQTRITVTEALIEAYEAAILALGTGGVQSYTIDTGQSRQTVTKMDLSQIQRSLDTLYNRLVTLQARLNGGTVLAVPAW